MIPQSLLNQYRREVEGASNDARKYLLAVSQAYLETNPNASVAQMRDYAIQAIQDGLYVFGDEAKLIANDFFDRLASLEGSSATAGMYDNYDADIIEQKVRYYAKSMAEGDTSKFIKDISDLTGYYVKREAFCNMAKNCDKQGLRLCSRSKRARNLCVLLYACVSRVRLLV